jgi:ADP-dependent phosphofructokinase/glucokinase
MYHHVFEYQTGDELNVWGAHVTALKANRIILEFDAVNHILPINPLFMDAIADPTWAVTRVLISGYTQVDTAAIARARIATTIEHVRRLRAVRPDLIFHLELASVTYPELLPPIIDEMALHTDSLGLNEQEIGLVAEAWQWAQPQSIAEQIETLARIRARTGVRRVGFHTQEYCLTLTEFDPRAERHSLLFASLVAGTRARLGRFPTMRDLHDTLASAQISAIGLAVEQRLEEMLCPRSLTACPGLTLNEGIGRYDNTWVVCAPTLSISHPAGTVGLGDSFTGGVLVFLDGNGAFTEMFH